ncbi:ArsR/SmtB family transcription factor [Brevundimonas sp. GCM10030266]|uniref:ArsR/SmtB family transcription factor n=1 Tax=Brevundimonas sp. GCM10030266 TaxID=3273386 RepID=UPI00361A1BA2
METSSAIDALGALAHEGRLNIFRTLVRAGPEGMPAGKLGEAVGMVASTLSNNLAILTRSGLTTSNRDGRSIIYAADYAHMTALLAFLMEDCCQGSPDVCAPLGEVISKAICCPPAIRQ